MVSTEKNNSIEVNDYFCDREKLLIMMTRNPSSNCVKQRRMRDIMATEALSKELQLQYNFNLIHASTKATLRFMRIKNDELKRKILKKLEVALTQMIDPITGSPLGRLGITEPMINDLIELETTGKIIPKTKIANVLNKIELGLLDYVFEEARPYYGSHKNEIETLYKKLKMINKEGA